MARRYGTTLTSIWRDPEFRSLRAGTQRIFMMLFSQHDVSPCGVLPLQPVRWARYAPDTTIGEIMDGLKVLEEGRYILIDEDTGEVAIRSLMKTDNVYNNPKRLPSIMHAIDQIFSDRLRAAMTAELRSLRAVARTASTVDDPETLFDAEPLGNSHSDSHPDSHTDSHGHSVTRARGRKTETETETETVTPKNPSGSKDPKIGSRLPADYQPTPSMIAWARQHAPSCGTADHESFVDYWLSVPGAKGVKRDWVATWRNWMRRNHAEGRSLGDGRRNGRPSTTDDRVQAGLALAERFAALDADERKEITS